MTMVRNILVMVVAVIVVAGCAKAPVAELEAARRMVFHASEVGAEHWSPGEYQLARDALKVAEQQIEEQQYRSAQRTLELSQRYAAAAVIETEKAATRIAELERRRLEQVRLAEETQQRVLDEQQEAQRLLELERRRKAELTAQAAAVRAATAAAAKDKKSEPPPAAAQPELVERYEVRAGQTLAAIAALPEVYGDSLLWPLIYRANRDQIKAPQEISAGQVLDVPRDKSREELEAARQEARDLNLF